MYRRRRLGPPTWVRLVLALPPAVLFPALGFFYMTFLDHPRRPRPVPIFLAAPLTVLVHTKDIGLAAMLMLLDMLIWFTAINAVLTGIGWLFERSEWSREH
ncbi:MAG: hypothetical protein ACHQJD_05040 [Thermoanaerobaculia bacterium]